MTAAGVRLILVVAGVVVLVASVFEIPILQPWRLVGMPLGMLIGWMMILAVPALVVCLLLVNHDRMRQLKRHLADQSRQLDELQGRGKVVRGPWRKSG